MKSWENKKIIDGGHCVFNPSHHYHTRLLNSTDERWYLSRHWTVSRFCQKEGGVAAKGNPDQDWQYLDCD